LGKTSGQKKHRRIQLKQLLLIACLFSSFLLIGCEKEKEYNYKSGFEEVIKSIKQEKWTKAKSTIKSIPDDYNNEIPILTSYIDANLVLVNKEDNEFEKAKNALTILGYVNFESAEENEILHDIENLKQQLTKQVEGTINDAEKGEKVKVEKAYHILWDKARFEHDSERVMLLNKAKNELVADGFPEEFISKYGEDAKIIYLYIDVSQLISTYKESASALEDKTYERDFFDNHRLRIIQQLKEIDPDATGHCSEDIMFNLKYVIESWFGISESEWRNIYNNFDEDMKEQLEKDHAEREKLKTMDPQIGMTKEEVQLTTWGNPQNINKTKTAYGTSVQWVYKINNKRAYIYFDDGVVTTIQD
jgi:hypothetical protein